jgi:hypothetical protein
MESSPLDRAGCFLCKMITWPGSYWPNGVSNSSGNASYRQPMTFRFVFAFLRPQSFRCVSLAALIFATACHRGQLYRGTSDPGASPDLARAQLLRRIYPGAFPIEPRTYPTGDAADVYRVVLDTLYMAPDGSPPIVVLYDLGMSRVMACETRSCSTFAPHRSRINPLSIRNYDSVTTTRTLLRLDFEYHLPLTVMTAQARAEMNLDGELAIERAKAQHVQQTENPFWVGFRDRYPGAWGYAVLSQVGFDPKHSEVIVQVMHRCGGSCGSIETMILEKQSDGWRVVARIPEQGEPSDQGIGTLRYRGPGARPPRSALLAFEGEDSLKRMQSPRSIRGVLTNSVTGAPIARATIVVHSAELQDGGPRAPWGKTYSDSLGRYSVFNPPIGSFMLEIECPPSRYRAGLVMDAPGEYLQPAENMVLNRSIDGRLCNGPTRARRLHSGALESYEARATRYPSGDAAAVYRAVLESIYPDPWKNASSVVLSHMTSSRCRDLRLCDVSALEWLTTKKELDSSTLENFREENQHAVPLRADFQYRHAVYLLTEDERRYLDEQAQFYDATFGDSNKGRDPTFWKMFNESFPSARGLVTLSRVGFDRRRTEAFAEVLYRDSKGTLEGSMFLLRRIKTTWSVVARF